MLTYRSQFILVMLIEFVGSIDLSNNQTYVFGHVNPDTDALVSAIVYADFLRRKNVRAKAYRLGEINNESKFVLKKARVALPDMLPSHLAEGTAVALVDHNESKR